MEEARIGGAREFVDDGDGTRKNMCQTREHVCFMQAKASGMSNRENRSTKYDRKSPT